MSTRTCRYGFLCLSLLVAAAGARGEELPPDGATEPCAPNQIAKLLASNGARVRSFGIVSAIDGDRAVVGTAPSSADLGANLRSAYVFERSGGTWTEVAELVSSDAASFDWFGFAVAIDGDTVVVGARDAGGVVAQSGAAYVFERQAGGAWIQSAKLFAADGIALERFGEEVAISGDTIAIGAEAGTTTVPHSGEVFLYERNAGGPGAWGQVAHVVAFDPRGGDIYGNSIDLDGDLMAVGASGDDDFGESSGSVYLYGRNAGGPGAWGLLAKLTADDEVAGDQFGHDVAVSGTTLLASAYFHAGADTRSGAAYVFERDLGGPDAWGQVTEIVASDGAFEDWFGRQVALDGDTAIVGAPLNDDGGSSSGSAYVFERHVGGSEHWGESAKLTAGDAQAGDEFGRSAGISGSILLFGAPSDDDDGPTAGSAYLFECVPGGGVDSDGDGFDDTIDCDDDDATIHPGAPEACDGIDNNCNGAVDEGLDADGDGLPDCLDQCALDPAKTAPEICGCGVPDTDSDGDGLADCVDACPQSDLSSTVIVGACDSGVGNTDLTAGCTIGDEIGRCLSDAGNHGQFVACVAHLTKDLKKDGVISGAAKGEIDSCAGQSSLP